MFNSILLFSMIALLVINFILDIKARKDRRAFNNKINDRINILVNRVNSIQKKSQIGALRQEIDAELTTISRENQLTDRTIDSIQEKLAELEVSIQNNHNNPR